MDHHIGNNEPLAVSNETTPLLRASPSCQRAESSRDAEEEEEEKRQKRSLRLTVFAFCLANFCSGSVYALLSPFYPSEAARKDTGMTVVGMIIGVFELSFMTFSPIFGSYLTVIGAKFMFCTGLMGCGLSAILFGFVDQIVPGEMYIVMCFVVRIFEGISAAAFSTASFAILAFTFPDRVATMLGILETFSGLGMMLGPPLGGALFQVGGFMLPFFVTGGLLFVIGCLGILLLQSHDGVSVLPRGSIFSLMRLPVVWLLGYSLIVCTLSVGFLDVNLSVHINNNYKLSPGLLGLIYLTSAALYGITAPIWGFIADKWVKGRCYLIMVGFIIVGVGFWILAPAPFLFHSRKPLWLLILSVALGGMGLASALITFSEFTAAARSSGHPESLETYGLVSGIFNLFVSLGAFAGPIFGGFLVEKCHFAWASTIMGAVAFSVTVAIFIYKFISCCVGSRSTEVIVVVADERKSDDGNS